MPQTTFQTHSYYKLPATTDLFCNHFILFHSLLGQRNVLYLLFMLALWYVTGMYEIFFAFTSYVHYFR